MGSIPGLGRSPGEGNGNSPQYTCLENPMDRGAWRATVHGVTVRHDWSNFTIDIVLWYWSNLTSRSVLKLAVTWILTALGASHLLLLLLSRSVVSDSSLPHRLQHARPPCPSPPPRPPCPSPPPRPPCPSPPPRACSHSCALNQCCHPSISSSVVPFSHLQSFPASGSFPMKIPRAFQRKDRIRRPKYWSFSFSIGPSNEYSELVSFRMDWFGLQSPRDCHESSPTPYFVNINSLGLSLPYGPTLTSIHDYWKNHSSD